MSELEREFSNISWVEARDGIGRCIISLQSQVNATTNDNHELRKQIERQQVEIDVLVRILGERKVT